MNTAEAVAARGNVSNVRYNDGTERLSLFELVGGLLVICAYTTPILLQLEAFWTVFDERGRPKHGGGSAS